MSGDKKGSAPAANFEKCSVVLVDVLGTTTSINFAKETLFPFVTKNAEEVLKVKWEEEDVKSAVKKLKEGEEEIDLETTAKLVKELTENESDNPGLKALQGIISEKGYESGDLKAHVFSDVPASFESWAKSRKVAIYSSGSADSQKHVFAKSTEGDLSRHISNYFDQAVGPKTESGSYKKIVEELGVKPEEVLFISDLLEEVKAAKTAGLSVAVIIREGNATLPEDSKDYPVISSFKEITFENSSKRKNVDEPAVTEEPPSKVAKIDSESKEESKNVGEKPKAKSSEIVEDKAMDVDAVAADHAEKPKEDATSDKPVENLTTTETTEKTETAEKTELTPVEDVTMKDADIIEEKTTKIEVSKSGDKTEEVVDSTEKTEIAEITAQENTQTQAEAVEEIEDEKKQSERAEETKKEESKEVNGGVLAGDDVSEKLELTEQKVEEQVLSPSKDCKDPIETESKTEESEKKTEATVEPNEVNSSSEEKNPSSEKPNDNTPVADSSVAVNVTDEVKTTVDSKESSKSVDDTLSEEKVDSAESPSLESNSPKVDEEKENKKDLANGLENGDTKTTTNGEEEVKVNGDSQTDGEVKEETKEKSKESASSEENVDEIKAKKAEATATAAETPAVSVEV
ncbi:enolase-phosphatase E1-like isoform X2 [Euwallacea fornicatus]|uniref:enolase-phosphatase E1-like isoform X2 n=1 Tax=Euwallacea fornicatus TaxID=995702 RepID=UPI00338E1500